MSEPELELKRLRSLHGGARGASWGFVPGKRVEKGCLEKGGGPRENPTLRRVKKKGKRKNMRFQALVLSPSPFPSTCLVSISPVLGC